MLVRFKIFTFSGSNWNFASDCMTDNCSLSFRFNEEFFSLAFNCSLFDAMLNKVCKIKIFS